MRFFVGLLLAVASLSSTDLARCDSLESRERAQLDQYLGVLKSGGLGSASQVDQLADISFAGLERIMSEYANVAEPIEAHSHRSWQTLLERTSRAALYPWPMVELYSPALARFLTEPSAEASLSQRLHRRLLESGGDRRSYDLTVRLTPGESLAYLAAGNSQHRVAILEAWNRRLLRGDERRPVANLTERLTKIVASFSTQLPTAERTSLLIFIGAWSVHNVEYRDYLTQCLRSEQVEVVGDGLAAQQQHSACLELNESVLKRFPREEKVVEAALRNYGGSTSHDFSAALRGMWSLFPRDQVRARYHLLLAMNAHPRGSDELALAAVFEQPFELLDVAMPILAAGDPQTARRAVEYILDHSHRGHEEALRLATRLKLAGFESRAVAIAGDSSRDQILRQAALAYLRSASGVIRGKFVPYLDHPNVDLRLSTIQMFANPAGLTAADKEAIGPALIRIALNDPSMGHRQEAVFALGDWREPQTEPLYRKLLMEYPPTQVRDGIIDSEQYWPYRMRVVSLLALAKLGDKASRAELLELHKKGGPSERMDVLLAFASLGEVPEAALEDLRSIDPKLVATAADAIARHGSEAARRRMKVFFDRSPLWQEFRGSGLDDHNVLKIVENAVQSSDRAPSAAGKESPDGQ